MTSAASNEHCAGVSVGHRLQESRRASSSDLAQMPADTIGGFIYAPFFF
jgi:hypothetical protein